MKSKQLPECAITIREYSTLDTIIRSFVDGSSDLQLLLLGNPGLGKSYSVKKALMNSSHLYMDGHAAPLGLYRELFAHKDEPVVIDDLDGVYAEKITVRLLKSLCNTDKVKTIRWHSSSPLIGPGANQTPPEFDTSSRVCLIGNEWTTLNQNVRAVEDRFCIVNFDPGAHLIHEKAGAWVSDKEVYDFIGQHLDLLQAPSFRLYSTGCGLKNTFPGQWENMLLSAMRLPPKTIALLEILADPSLATEEDKARAFTAKGLGSRATYFNRKKKLPPQARNRQTLRFLDSQQPQSNSLTLEPLPVEKAS